MRLPAPLSDVQIAPSFQANIDRSGGPAACWPWTGSLMSRGYGQTRVKTGGRWRGAGAHQVAHFMATGRWERKAQGRLVRHLCHNRRCCNPLHLAGGTHLDNAFDRQDRLARRNRVLRPLCLPVVGVAA